MSPYLHERHFSLDEAQQALIKIRPLIQEVRTLKAKLDRLGFSLSQVPDKPSPQPSTNGHKPFPSEFIRLTYVLNRLVRLGIQIRDMSRGLIDFPHIRKNGEEVYLCWKMGEKVIRYWHPVDEGFSGRRHIDKL